MLVATILFLPLRCALIINWIVKTARVWLFTIQTELAIRQVAECEMLRETTRQMFARGKYQPCFVICGGGKAGSANSDIFIVVVYSVYIYIYITRSISN